MAIAFRAASTGGGSALTSIDPGKPAGTVSTDVLVAVVCLDAATAVTWPSGWTALGGVTAGTLHGERAWALGSVASTNFTFASSIVEAQIRAYSGVDNTTPMDATSTSNSGTTGAPTSPSITTVTDNAMHVPSWCQDDNASLTGVPPTGYTNNTQSNNGLALDSANKLISPAGATGTLAITGIGNIDFVAFSFALRPVVAAPVKILATIIEPVSLLPGPWQADTPLFYPYNEVPPLAAVAIPNVQSDWPVPQRYISATALRTWSDSLRVNLISLDTFFGDPGQTQTYDYPNPVGTSYLKKAWPTANLTWVWDVIRFTLPGLDSQFGAAGQWKTYDYPNPTLKPDDVNRRTWLGDIIRLTLVGRDSLPFRRADWPNPTLKLPNLELRTHLWIPLITLLKGQDSLPFRLSDWPNPQIPRRANDLLTWLQSLVNRTLIGLDSLPFSLSDWPNPRGFGPSIDLRIWAQSLVNTTLGIIVAVPFAFYDWLNPIRARPKHHDLQGSYTLPLIGQDALPFSQSDWPVPKGPALLTNLRTWIADLVRTTLVGLDSLPFRLNDWPNPLRYVPSIDLRSWLQSLVNLTLSVIALPFSLLDWPNPFRRQPKHQDHQASYDLSLIGQDQFFAGPGQPPANLDWPVPKGPTHPTSLRSWFVDLLQTTLLPIIPSTVKRIVYDSGRIIYRLTTWLHEDL